MVNEDAEYMEYQEGRTKPRMRQAVLIWAASLTGLLVLLAVWANVGLTQGEEATVSFTSESFAFNILPGQTPSLPVTVTLSIPQAAEVTVTYEVTSEDPTAGNVVTLGEDTVVIPASTLAKPIILTVKDDPTWTEGSKTLKIKLKSVEPATVELADPKDATVTLRRCCKAYVSGTFRDEAWLREEKANASVKSAVRSLAVCPSDNPNTIRYLGSDEGLFRWQTVNNVGVWEPVMDQDEAAVPGSVREIAFGASCDDVFAAVTGSGVWRKGDDNAWNKINAGAAGDDLLTSRTVVVRDDVLYVGTDKGVYYIDLDPDGDWIPTLPDKIIARLTLVGSRIYAAVWTEGVAYDDGCPTACDWQEIAGPAEDRFVREVIGPPPDGQNPPAWLIFATASTVYYLDGWEGETPLWLTPAEEEDKPQPTGNVFSLAQDREYIFAGVENGGVWRSINKGETWKQIGDLRFTVRDLAITATGQLFAATFDAGVWR